MAPHTSVGSPDTVPASTDPQHPYRASVVPASYVDSRGEIRDVCPSTHSGLLAGLAPAGPRPLVLAPGEQHPLLARVQAQLAPGAPSEPGYHHVVDDGVRRLVLLAPPTLPQPRRGYGVAVQLYSALSTRSWGIGDFADLRTLTTTIAGHSGSTVLLSPLHAMAPTTPAPNSPYSPASRLWLNVLHIAVEDAAGAHRVDLSAARSAGLGLARDAFDGSGTLDRDAVGDVKLPALRAVFDAAQAATELDLAAFEAWRTEQGRPLELFATWSVLARHHGADWRAWPAELGHPDGSAVDAFAARYAGDVAFHAWLQWVADTQLGAACTAARGAGIDVCLDLAVGFDLPSADAWIWQDLLLLDYEVGCPPDRHNLDGQRWGLPPFDPNALVAAGLEPFVATLRANLRHAAGLRLDHVMQLWRLFAFPRESTGCADALHSGVDQPGCVRGAYLHYPVEALLAAVRIEAAAAGAWVVGEDMGTVVPGAREIMASIGMLGYRCATRTPPEDNAEATLGASSTHDQATIAGILTGYDAVEMAGVGVPFDAEAFEGARAALALPAMLDLNGPLGEEDVARAVRTQYARLAASPSRVVLATLEDMAGMPARPNIPGTVDERPNWRLPLPAPLEDLLARRLALQVLVTLTECRALRDDGARVTGRRSQGDREGDREAA